jgi:small subunit ribosomal protein S4
MNTKAYAPGKQGTRRRRQSDYGKQLREKQKVKRIYGLLEKQFRRYVDDSLSKKGVSGEMLMHHLETRLDNMVYRSGFAVSRAQARQFVRSGYFMINEKVVTIPSYQIKVGDVIRPVNFEKLHLREGFILPEWLEANVKERYVRFTRLPDADEVSENINVQLIIEFYSR